MGRREGELTLPMEIASNWLWRLSAVLVPVTYLICHLWWDRFGFTKGNERCLVQCKQVTSGAFSIGLHIRISTPP